MLNAEHSNSIEIEIQAAVQCAMDIANSDSDRDVSCLHGSWVDGICKCNSGYVTEFTDTELYPVYCAKKDDIVILNLRAGFEPIDIFHYMSLSVCDVYIFLHSCYVFFSAPSSA